MDEPRRRIAAMISGLDVHYDLGEGHPLLGRRMPDLDLHTADGPTRVFALLHDARPVLLDLGEPGGFDLSPWADRVRLVDAEHDGAWELPVLGEVPAPPAVLIRPDGHVAWAGDLTDPELPRAPCDLVRSGRCGVGPAFRAGRRHRQTTRNAPATPSGERVGARPHGAGLLGCAQIVSGAAAPPGSLELDGGAGALEGGLGLLGVFLAGLLDHGLGGGLDQVLGLLETQAGERAHLLDDRDLLATGLGEDDVELGLLLLGGGVAAPAPGPATATGAAAVTPNFSSKSLSSSLSSSTVMLEIESRISSLVAMS